MGWEENSSWIQKMDRKTKCDLKHVTPPLWATSEPNRGVGGAHETDQGVKTGFSYGVLSLNKILSLRFIYFESEQA